MASTWSSAIPRPSGSSHHYLFDVAESVYATDRSGGTPSSAGKRERAGGPPLILPAPAFVVGRHRMVFPKPGHGRRAGGIPVRREPWRRRVITMLRDGCSFTWLKRIHRNAAPQSGLPVGCGAQPEPDLEQAVVLRLPPPANFRIPMVNWTRMFLWAQTTAGYTGFVRDNGPRFARPTRQPASSCTP